MTKNHFITFEGIDGSGKSTQAKILVEKLQTLNLETLFLREPGGTSIAEEIRSVLLNNREEEMSSRSEALLMCASRAQLTKDIIALGEIKKFNDVLNLISSFSIKLSDFNVKIPKVVFMKIDENVKINLNYNYELQN